MKSLANKDDLKDAYERLTIAMRPKDLTFERTPKDGKKPTTFVGREFRGSLQLEDGRIMNFELRQENGKSIHQSQPARTVNGKDYPAGDVVFMSVSLPKKSKGGVL